LVSLIPTCRWTNRRSIAIRNHLQPRRYVSQFGNNCQDVLQIEIRRWRARLRRLACRPPSIPCGCNRSQRNSAQPLPFAANRWVAWAPEGATRCSALIKARLCRCRPSHHLTTVSVRAGAGGAPNRGARPGGGLGRAHRAYDEKRGIWDRSRGDGAGGIGSAMSAIRDPSGVLILQDHQERLRHRRLTGIGGA
jgi:hypothetical protein